MSRSLLAELDEIAKLIGKTPVMKPKKVVSPSDASVHVKLEYMNPGGSHKDRIAYYMLKEQMEKDLLTKGGPVIDVSSGNTALSLAWMAARLGLKATFVVDEEISNDKIAILELLGASVIKVKQADCQGEDPRFVEARALEEKLGGVFMDQFSNEANFRAHYETTAREIVNQLDKEVHAFVMGIGTGGTITGVGKYLKEALGREIRVVGIVPEGSAVLHGKSVGMDRIEGLTKHTVPGLYTRHRSCIDEVIELSEGEAVAMAKRLAREEGLFVGPSTGAAVVTAKRIAEELGPGKNVVTLAADGAFRYARTFGL